MIQSRHNAEALIIHGAGGHGLVVAEAALAAGRRLLGFIDDRPSANPPLGFPLLTLAEAETQSAEWIVAVGDNATRFRLLEHHQSARRSLARVIHPHASVSGSATLEPGVFVGPRAVVHSEAVVRFGAVVNSAAVVEHHVTLGPCSHVAPNATLGGAAQAGARTLVGLGASVLPGIKLGDDACVGAGAVVTRDVLHRTTVRGIPAK